jgi:hypothetical protein
LAFIMGESEPRTRRTQRLQVDISYSRYFRVGTNVENSESFNRLTRAS